MKLIKSLFASLLISGFVSFLFVGTIYTRIEGTQLDESALILDTKPTIIHDDGGEVLAKFFKERRNTAMYDEIPQEIIDSYIATEDRDFFSHSGISVRAITRAALSYIQLGEVVQGGSTITQQVMKNKYLSAEQSLERKQKEAIYASLLEKKYSKEEILEMYLNDNEYGNRAYGIKDALMTYFGQTFEQFKKDTRENRILKAAFLTGLSNNPTLYSPYRNGELNEKKMSASIEKRNSILENLYIVGKISKKELDEFSKKPLLVLKNPMTLFPEQKFDHQELVHYALYEAADILGKSIDEVKNSGIDIYTSYDIDIYDILRDEYSKSRNFPRNGQDGTQVQSAAVYLNPKNGRILAFTGAREELTEFLGFNRAFMMKRQPGSIIKPVIDYGPALESGKFGRYSLLADDKGHVFPGGYVVDDWDKGGRGKVTMEEALRQSWNIPAVWTLQQVGIKYATEYALKLGIDFRNEKSGLSMALGGVETGVSPLQMADSYQAFANNGIRTPAHAITKITDANGNVIFQEKVETEPIINPKNAKTMKEMLRNVVARGTSTKAQIAGRKIAGKTGTTQHPLINGKPNNDIWFVGFDEEVLGAIWMGFDTTSTKHYLTDGSKITAQTFSRITKRILDYKKKNQTLEKPEDIVGLDPPPDSKPPVISLIGEGTVTLDIGDEFVDRGVTVKDDRDGDITSRVVVGGSVNTEKAGTYVITYSVADAAGNESQITRTVIVKKKEEENTEEKKPESDNGNSDDTESGDENTPGTNKPDKPNNGDNSNGQSDESDGEKPNEETNQQKPPTQETKPPSNNETTTNKPKPDKPQG